MYTFDIPGHPEKKEHIPNGIVRGLNEYWDYYTSGKMWDKSRNGLLNFIYDCVMTLNKLGVNDSTINKRLYDINGFLEKIKT